MLGATALGERRYDYEREESIVRGAWQATIAPPVAMTEEEIRTRAACSPQAAWRIFAIRRAGVLPAIDLWLEGTVTLRQLERVITLNPFDEEGQMRELLATSPAARLKLQRIR